MNTDLSKKSVVVCDYGLFTPLAERLAQAFECVYYCNLTRTGWPVKNRDIIGEGLDGIQVVENYHEVLDEVDLIVFPDCHDGAEQAKLRDLGYRVFGMGPVSNLEEDRVAFRQWQQKVGLPCPKSHFIYGMEELRDYLEEHPKVWVKIVRYRGLMETFYSPSLKLSEPKLVKIEHEAGSDELEFVVEEPLESVCEVGYDGMVSDGLYPDIGMYGYEIKDRAYVGKIAAYAALPQQIQFTNEKLKQLFSMARGLWSTELRITKDGKPFLIDPTFRFPSPPFQAELEAYKNFPEAVWDMANGHVPILKPAGKYVALAMLKSTFADEGNVNISFPDSIKQWVKLGYHRYDAKQDVHVVVPQDKIEQVGAVVAVEDTLEQAITVCKERAKLVEGTDLTAHADQLDEAQDVIKAGEKVGVKF